MLAISLPRAAYSLAISYGRVGFWLCGVVLPQAEKRVLCSGRLPFSPWWCRL